jgi:hypothetical protein
MRTRKDKDCVVFRGIEFEFDYTWTAGRPATWEDPEEYDEWEIYNITINDVDAEELVDCFREEFEEEVINKLKD